MNETEKYLAYLKALKRPFQKLCRLRFLNPDGSTAFSVDNNEKNKFSGAFVASGTLAVNLQNGTRRTATVTLANLDGAFDYNVNSLWFGQEVALDEGLVLPNGEDYYIQQGVFLLEEPEETVRPGERTVTYHLTDKWANLDGTLWGKLEGTYRGAKGANIFAQISVLLQDDRGNGQKVDGIDPVYTDYYNGGLHFLTGSGAATGWIAMAGDGNGGAVAIGTTSSGYTTDGGKTWTQVSKVFYSTAAIAYGNGVYVVIDGSEAHRSTDGGKTWSEVWVANSWGDSALFGAAYGDGVFILTCGAYPNKTAISSDGGLTWTLGTMPSIGSGLTTGISYVGDGKFLAYAATARGDDFKNYIYTIGSSDKGATWRLGSTMLSDGTGTVKNEPVVTGGNGRGYIFLPETNLMWWSDDLSNWTQIELPYTAAWKSAAFGNSILALSGMIGGRTGVCLFSNDGGKTWRTAAGALKSKRFLIGYVGGSSDGFAAVDRDGNARYSVPGMAQETESGEIALLTDAPYTLEVSPETGTYADVILGFAEMLNAWVGYDATGRLRIEPSQDDISDVDKPVCYSFSTGQAELLGMTYKTENAAVYNDYIVVGEALDNGAQPVGRATNYDPGSDTNVNLIGRKTVREAQSGYVTKVQCEDRAVWELKKSAILKKSVNVSCSQIFHITENELIEIIRTDKPGFPIERHLVQGFTRALTGTEAMSISAVSVNDYPRVTIET